jgi:class 3 adenylate cyclase
LYSQSQYEIQPIPYGKVVSLANSQNFTFWVTTQSIQIDDYKNYPLSIDEPNEIWKQVEVPKDLLLQNFTYSKKFWYRKVFIPQATEAIPLSFRLGEISDRDRVYLNGELIGTHGEFGSEFPQGYDKVRIYDIPPSLIRWNEVNVLLIEVEPFFKTEYGIYRDRLEIGPTIEIRKSFFIENGFQVLILVVYTTVAFYFLLFFVRRRSERENLYFSLFLFGLIAYSFLKTQWKYELPYSFYLTKKTQFLSVFSLAPPFYFFVRNYFKKNVNKSKLFDSFFIIINLSIFLSAIVVLFSNSAELWDQILNYWVQPTWLLYAYGVFRVITISILKKDVDAYFMLGALVLLFVSVLLDSLGGRGILNLPPITTYSFIFFVLSLALVLANRFVNLHNETELLNENLTKFNKASSLFVPFEFLQLLEKKSILDVKLGDQVQKEMSVLFSDIRSFTTLSENMTPKENFDFINSYLSRVGPAIRDHKGFIDKYIGDAIMALFPSDAEDALLAAIEMQSRVSKHNDTRLKRGHQELTIGIGIHTGKLMLGTIGEQERMEGTVISDSVNLASRLEGLTKYYGVGILLSESSIKTIKNLDKYKYRYIDRVKVKGKSEAISIYEFYDSDTSLKQNSKDNFKLEFQKGLDFYYKKDFKTAIEIFSKVYSENQDKVSEIYKYRAEKYSKGIPDDWNGEESIDEK